MSFNADHEINKNVKIIEGREYRKRKTGKEREVEEGVRRGGWPGLVV